MLIFEQKWHNYASGPKSAANSDWFCIFNVYVRVFCAPNVIILLVYIPARAQNVECSFGCVARSVVVLKPNVANILLFSFYELKFVQHGSITIVIDCNGLSLLIFEAKFPNYASGPKSAPNSDSFCSFTYSPRSK